MKIPKLFKKAAAFVMAAVTALSIMPATAFAAGDIGTISFSHTYDSNGNAMRYNSSANIGGYTAGGTGNYKYRIRRIYPMKLFKKNENKKTTKLPMTGKVKKGFRYYCMAVMAMTFVLGTSVTAFAANDPIQVVNNLSDFIFGLVRAVGMIMLGFGIVQIGLSLKSHDPSQRANGFLTLAGGVVITFAKEILTLITG